MSSIININKNFCPAPFRQISINPSGQLSPCCMINEVGFGEVDGDSVHQGVNDLLNAPAWQEFLQAHRDEKMPAICEKYCSISGATAEYHNQWNWAIHEGWVEKEYKIERADISFSNICNLTCTMCNETFSSEWGLRNKNSNVRTWNFNNDQSRELAQLVKNCNVINIKGGEPMMNNKFLTFLQALAELNTNIHIPILSNGTVINDEILTEYSKFKSPTIAFSMESTRDDLYRFIRGGTYSYSKDILDNLQYIKKNYPLIHMKTNYLIGAFNINDMYTDIDNMIRDGFDEINIILITAGPPEQSLNVVHPRIKNEFASKFLSFVEERKDYFKTFIKDKVHINVFNELNSQSFNHIERNELENKIQRFINMRKSQGIDINSISDLVPNYFSNAS